MKKAGILIGVIVIVIALVLFGLSEWIEKKNVEKITKGVQEEVVTEKKQPDDKVKEVIVDKPVEKIVEKKITEVKPINETTLGEPYVEKESIVVIASKRFLLIDESTGTLEGKMLTYCFDVLTTDNIKLVLFMTETSYNNYNIGDKLLVKYKLYKNTNNVVFPVVLSVNAITE